MRLEIFCTDTHVISEVTNSNLGKENIMFDKNRTENDHNSDLHNPNNDYDLDDWADAHNPNNEDYIGD